MGLVMNYRNGKFLMGLYILYKDLVDKNVLPSKCPTWFFFFLKKPCVYKLLDILLLQADFQE
jgi:hypothetical protein